MAQLVVNGSADAAGDLPDARPRGGLRTVVVVVAVLLAVDVVAGAGLNAIGRLPAADRGDVYRLEHAVPGGPRPEAWRDEPWAEDLMAELVDFQTGEYHVVPYLQQRSYAFEGRYLNTTDEERVSAQPAAPPGVRPVRVAFFGGSVVFGIGQRDAHTIPSAFARIAADAGVAVEVHNYGFPRWVAWQEYLRLEALLAAGERFDLVVFLDGYNEFLIQGEGWSADPSHHAAAAIDELIGDFRQQRATPPGAADGLAELLASYRRASATWRLVDAVRGRTVPLPGAAVAARAQRPPAEQADAALDVYARTVARVRALAARHDTPVRFLWQPQRGGWPDDVLRRLPEGVTDVSHAFDGREDELYFDPIHTNEAGAALLAGAIWEAVGADVAAAAR